MHYHLGLAGYPLSHSFSPVIQQAALQAAGLSGSYRLFPIEPHPGRTEQITLVGLIDRMRQGEIHGLNITIPFKQTILKIIDHSSERASHVGAVNTLNLQDGRIIGENTDIQGFQRDLERLGFHEPLGAPRRALVLGSGGAARAVVHTLIRLEWQIDLVARRPQQGEELARALSAQGAQLAVKTWAADTFQGDYGLIVNTTPLGMPPQEHSCPWPQDVPMPENAAVYDLGYFWQSPLLRAADAVGLRAATGLGMLIEQAAHSFEIWTGKSPPRKPLWEAAEQELSRKQTMEGVSKS